MATHTPELRAIDILQAAWEQAQDTIERQAGEIAALRSGVEQDPGPVDERMRDLLIAQKMAIAHCEEDEVDEQGLCECMHRFAETLRAETEPLRAIITNQAVEIDAWKTRALSLEGKLRTVEPMVGREASDEYAAELTRELILELCDADLTEPADQATQGPDLSLTPEEIGKRNRQVAVAKTLKLVE